MLDQRAFFGWRGTVKDSVANQKTPAMERGKTAHNSTLCKAFLYSKQVYIKLVMCCFATWSCRR